MPYKAVVAALIETGILKNNLPNSEPFFTRML